MFTLKQRFTIWSTALGSLLVFGFIGWGLDRLFNSWPIIFVIAILLSFPVAIAVVIKRLQPVIKADLERLEKEMKN